MIAKAKATATARFGSLRLKVAALAVVPLCGILMVGLVELVTGKRVQAARSAYETEASEAQHLKAFDGDMHAIRLLAEDFRWTQSARSADDFRATTHRLAEALDAGAADGSWASAALLQKPLGAVREAFDAYHQSFEALGLSETEGLNRDLRLAGMVLRHAINNHAASFGQHGARINESLAEIALKERELKVGRDVGVHDLMVEETKRISAILRAVGVPTAAREEIGTKMDAYTALVGSYARQQTAVARSFGTMSGGFQQLAETTGAELVQRTAQAAGALAYRDGIDRERAWLLAVTLGIAAILAGFLSAVVLRAFNGRFMPLVSATQALSAGSDAVELETLRGRDEIGALAEALQVFRANGLERQRLVSQRAEDAETRATAGREVAAAIALFEASIETALGKVRGAAATLEDFARTLDGTAEEMAGRATTAGDETAASSSEIESVSVAAQQLAPTRSRARRLPNRRMPAPPWSSWAARPTGSANF
jgi:methyl-accepting chemotaxis protein